MKITPALLLLIILYFHLPVAAQNYLPFVTDSIHSATLNESRELRIILPKEYKPGSARRYEVMYILDGEWYQELVPFFYNFAEFAGYLPKSIFVLIRNRYYNGRNLRDRDFSPTHIPQDSLTGGADRFYDFLTKEVVPYIEQKYPASGQRSLVGSSYSGLFSVYAFLKGPTFFQSFIASDPNINFDQHYVTRLAAKTLPGLSGTPGTLFIGGRTNAYREMGILGFDSVLKVHAPAVLHWQCIPYENETHYSVQLKAFYEGMRFSHFGYSAGPPEFHPMNGLLSAGRSFTIYFLNQNAAARYTEDRSAPTATSPVMMRDHKTVMTPPGQVRVKTFGNRAAYVKEWTNNFLTSEVLPKPSGNKKVKGGLTYQLFDGSGDSLPDLTSRKPVQSGVADSLLRLNTLLHQRSSFLLIEGMIDIPQDAEYLFYANGYDAVALTVGGKTLFKEEGSTHSPSQSYIVSLTKGKYPLRLELLHITPTLEPHFTIYRSTGRNDHWWENKMLDF